MARILVTPRSVTRQGHPALKRLEACGYEVVLGPADRQPSEAELLSLLPGCVGYLAGVEPVRAQVLAAAAPTLKAISRNGTGTDSIDVAAAHRFGVKVLAAAGSNARGVAELTLGLLLVLARGIVRGHASVKGGGWERFPGFELEGRVLGVLGYGNVGRRVASLAAALGMRVIVHDPVLGAPAADAAASPVAFASSAEVIRSAGILTLHCPPGADGRPLLDRAALASMAHGSHVINTARFDLIDECAMLEALQSGRIAGLALDVFNQEPPGRSSLVDHPNVVTTPHLGGYTRESVDRAMEGSVANLLAALASKA